MKKVQIQPLDITPNHTEEDDTSSLGSDSLIRANFVHLFQETPNERRRQAHLQRDASSQKIRLSFDDKILKKDARIGLLSRGKSNLLQSVKRTPSKAQRLSWMSVATLDLSQPLLQVIDLNEVVGEKFKLLLKPPKFDRDDLLFSIHTFMSSIVDFIPGVKLDKTFQIFKDIRTLLRAPECIRLYGLLIHYCYWNIIHPTARNSMKEVKFTHQRRNSFADVDLSQPLAILSTQNRIGLLPEILETDENNNHHFSYDEENISPKHRNYSFMVMNTANSNGGYISPTMLKGTINSQTPTGRLSGPGMISFASSMGMKSNDTDENDHEVVTAAKTMDQIDELFQQHLDQINEEEGEGEDPPFLDHGDNSSIGTKEGLFPVQNENMTNIPFTINDPNLTVSTEEIKSRPITDTQNSSSYPWLTTDGSITGGSLSSEASLTFHEREQLFIQLETCITTLFKKMGRGKFAMITGRQSLISCCHYIVDDILTAMYPWFAQVHDDKRPKTPQRKASVSTFPEENPLEKNLKDLNLRLRRLVHQSISDLIDPSRIYTSSMLLNLVLGLGTSKTLKEATRKAKDLLDNESTGGRRGKYYRTSTAVLALFGDSHSPMARKFLQRSATLYSSVPGAVEPFESKLDKIGEWEEPLEYFNTLKQQEIDAKLLLEDQKITEKDLERMEIQRITQRVINGEEFTSPDRDSKKHRTTSTTGSRSRSPYRSESSRPGSQQSRGRSSSAGRHPTGTGDNAGSSNSQKVTDLRRKPLDFMNLFQNQPDANFFPQPAKKDTTTATTNSHNIFSPNYRNRSRSASPIGSPFSPSQQRYPSSPNLKRTERGRSKERRLSSPAEEKRFIHRKTKKNIHKIRSSLFFGDSNKEGVIGGKGRNLSFLQQRPLVPHNSTNSAIGYLANEESLTLHSSSVGSDSLQSLSLVNNEYAEIPISLNAKAALMNLMVSKTAQLYQTKIQTRQTAQRIALLRGEEVSLAGTIGGKKKSSK